MAINLRTINGKSYVTETRRERGKLVQTHVGAYSNPCAQYLYRESQWNNALAKRLRRETTSIRKESREIENSMKQIVSITDRFPILDRLIRNHPRNGRPMRNRDKDRRRRRNRSAEKPEAQSVDLAAERLPAKRAFGRLCREADQGDPDAIRKLEELVSQAPYLLESIADLIGLVRESVLRVMSAKNNILRQALDAKISRMKESIKVDQTRDPILGMTAELVAVSYLDAMRCSLHAAKEYENRTDADHFQGLADRSLRRFKRIQQVYQTVDSHIRQPQG